MEIPSPLAAIFTGLSTKLRSSLQFLWESCGFQAKFFCRAPVDACHNEGGSECFSEGVSDLRHRILVSISPANRFPALPNWSDTMTNLPKERIFKVAGMTCGHCQKAVEAAIGQLDGVQSVRVDLKAGEAKVVGHVNDQAVTAAVDDAGYAATPTSP